MFSCYWWSSVFSLHKCICLLKERKLLVVFTTFLLTFLCGVNLFIYSAGAHDSKSVHTGIAEEAIELEISENGSESNLAKEIKSYSETIKIGSEEEDYPEPGEIESYLLGERSISNTAPEKEGFLYQDRPFWYHFYNPKTGEGWPGKPTAPEYAKRYLDKSCQYYSRGEKVKAYYVLGRTIHLLEDMSVPAHTNNILHLPFVQEDNFENYAKGHINDLDTSGLAPKHIKGVIDAMNPLAWSSHNANSYTFADVWWRKLTCYQEKENEFGIYYRKDLDDEELQEMMEELIPPTVQYCAGLIDYFWENKIRPNPGSPGGDNPDETYSVASSLTDGSYYDTGLDTYLRLAIKKDKLETLYYNKFEAFANDYFELPPGTSESVIKEHEKNVLEIKSYIDRNRIKFNYDFDSTPDVAVLKNGYYESFISILYNYKEPFVLIGQEFSPEIAKDHPVLVIPSGGLYGLDSSPLFKLKLEEYVKSGGTLVVLDQQYGKEYQGLPGGELNGRGWREAISCRSRDAEIDTYNPILSGLSDSIASTNQDGFFTEYPEESTILLRGTTRANGYPVMLMYPFGKGNVIATSIYADWSYGISQAFPEEIAMIRDIISWAKYPVNIPEYGAGEQINITQKIHNISETDATKVKLTLLNPSRREIHSETHNFSLSSGEEREIVFDHNAPTFFGIYYIDYTLLDDEGRVVQPQAEGARFSISKFKVKPGGFIVRGSEISSSISMTDERLAKGSDALFTVHLYNSGDTDKNVIVQYDGAQKQLTVPADSGESFAYTKSNVQSSNVFSISVTDEDGNQLASASKGYWVFTPSAKIALTTNKEWYQRGENAAINLAINNLEDEAYTSNVKVKVINPEDEVINETDFDIDLGSLGTANKIIELPLAFESKFGFYSISAEINKNGMKIGSNTTCFEIPGPRLSVKPILPDTLTSNTMVSYKIENVGLLDSSGQLEVALKNQDGDVIWSEVKDYIVHTSQNTLLDFNVPLTSLEFDNYSLSHKLTTEGRTLTGKTDVPCSVAIKPSFDKTSYRVREQMNINLEFKNDGKYFQDNIVVDIAVPDVGFTNTQTVSLNSGQSTVIPYTIILPDTLPAGQHNINVTTRLANSFSKTFTFTVPESKLGLGLDKGDGDAGESVVLKLINEGGRDTSYECPVKLIDTCGHKICDPTFSGEILAGETKAILIPIPEQATSGHYFIISECKDIQTSRKCYYSDLVEIAGLDIDLTVQTDEEQYLSNETITTSINATNLGRNVENASLELQIEQAGDSELEGIHFNNAWPQSCGFTHPQGVGVDSFGNIYVADTDNNRIQKFNPNRSFLKKWGCYGTEQGEFNGPNAITVDSLCNIYVVDCYNNRIQKFDTNGNFITQWGGSGSGIGQFYSPCGIAADSFGNIYVADDGNRRIQKFDTDGNLLTQWGSPGSGDGQFYCMSAIAVDMSGNVYVAESDNQRIQKFDAGGNFLAKWAVYEPGGLATDSFGNIYVSETNNHRIKKFNTNGVLLTQWGGWGWGNGQFIKPRGLTVDSSGNLCVADTDNNRIQTFDQNGSFITKLGSRGKGNGEFYSPSRIALDPLGNIYVADTINNRIQKFDAGGNYITQWGSYGLSGDGKFNYPEGIAIDSFSNVYVADCNNRIQKFDSNGNFITKWGSRGVGDGQFYYPNCIAVDRDGSVYVTDTNNHRIQKFDSNGIFITKWGIKGTGDGEFSCPCGIDVDENGDVYVADTANNRIQKFDGNGIFLTQWGSPGWLDGQFNRPYDLGVDSSGNIFVVDKGNDRIQKLSPYGTFIAKWGESGTDEGKFIDPKSIAVGTSGEFYIADTGNDRVQAFNSYSGSMSTVWHKNIPFNLTASDMFDIKESIGALNTTGKLYFKSMLKSSTRQIIASDSYSFYIFPGSASLILSTDKDVYKPGEDINIKGEVRNNSEIPIQNREILVYLDESKVYSELIDILNPGETHSFDFSIKAQEEAILKGAFCDAEVSECVEISTPIIEMSVEAPEIVGSQEFDIDISLKNTSTVDANINLKVCLAEDASDSENLILKAGETRIIKRPFRIKQEATFNIILSGDVEQTITKEVLFGEDVETILTVEDIYPEGSVNSPYRVENTGELDAEYNLAFRLNDEEINKLVYLSKGAAIEDNLDLGVLSAGDYTLTCSTLSEEETISFKVVKRDQLNMDVFIYDNLAGLSAPPLLDTKGKIAVYSELVNSGYDDFSGFLRVETDFDNEEVELNIKTGEEEPYLLLLDSETATPGFHNAKITLLNSSGNKIQEVTKSFEVRAPSFEIIAAPSNQSVSLGEHTQMSFVVRNNGNLEGEVTLNLDVVGIDQQSKSIWIKPGEICNVTFNVYIPDDLEENNYKALFNLNSGEQHEFALFVKGVKISVDAGLGKEYYASGETATLTIQIGDESGLTGLDMYARAQLGEEVSTQCFSLADNQTIVLNIPITDGNERLSYGIYMQSGRAIYLNSLYVRQQGDVITLIPDRQVYQAGDTVNIEIQTEQVGILKVITPDNSKDIEVGPGTSFDFVLPEELKSGTYTIDYTFSEIEGSVPIDVQGYSAKVVECKLDKTTFQPQDTMNVDFKVETKNDFHGVIKGWILDSSGDYTEIFDVEKDFSQGENLVEATASLNLNQAGTQELVYGVYKTNSELLLASGQESFDVEGVSIVTLSTDRIDYPSIDQRVVAKIGTFGHTRATLSIAVDDKQVEQRIVDIDGYINLVIPINNVKPGEHTLKATLASGQISEKTCDFIFGSELQDLTLSPADISLYVKPVSDGSEAYLNANICNTGNTDAENITVRFYDGNPAEGGTQIGTDQVIPKIESRGTGYAQVLLSDPTMNGEHLIYVVVDQDNSIFEFSEQNNTIFKHMDIDIIPPSTSISIGDPKYGNEPIYINSKTKISLVPADERTGIGRTEYRINEGKWISYKSPFEIADEGQTLLTYRSTDVAGNIEEVKTLSIYVDNTPPACTMLSPNPNGTYIFREPVKLELDIKDMGSGIASRNVFLNGNEVTLDYQLGNDLTFNKLGDNNFTIKASDNLGNKTEETNIFYVTYDIKWQPPIKYLNESTTEIYRVQDSSTFPIKWIIYDYFGNVIIDPNVQLKIYNHDEPDDTNKQLVFYQGSGSDYIRFDPDTGQYIVNLHTKDYSWMNIGDFYNIEILGVSEDYQYIGNLLDPVSFQIVKKGKTKRK